MSPQRSDLVLTTDIPDVELDILIDDRLDVKPDGGDGGDILIELQLIEDSWSLGCGDDQLSLSPMMVRSPTGTENHLHILVFPAASNPNMSNRISFDPKIFPIILEICPPMMTDIAISVCGFSNSLESWNMSWLVFSQMWM